MLSAVIDLEPHQVNVVNRVLQDPVQRYLLADEVGLGKTIEAGAIIRQYVLDCPQDHAVVLILPKHLLSQWRAEICNKFLLQACLDKTIHLIARDDISKIKVLGETAGLVVIDEAHHVASWESSSEIELNRQFNAIKAVAHRASRLLLLSATPALHNERSFLAMLHLLDPSIHSLDGLEAFRTRIARRQEVAESFQVLQEDTPNFFIEKTVEELSASFPDDHRLGQLIDDLKPRIQFDAPEDDPERVRCIQAIRIHLGEVYRLHRRLVRNRRVGDLEELVPGRVGLERLGYDDALERWVEQALDDWRINALESLGGQEDGDASEGLGRVVLTLCEIAGCDPALLPQAIDVRRGRYKHQFCPDLHPVQCENLQGWPLFSGEREILNNIVESFAKAQGKYSDTRLDRLVRYLQDRSGQKERIIVFADNPTTADRVYEGLCLAFDPRLSWRQNQDTGVTVPAWARFIVCDRFAEEGVNLQGGKALMVHYDLPCSPNRIEQRIGRLDRFGVAEAVRSICFVPEEVYFQTAWLEFLDGVCQVFNRSIASLQYLVEDWMEDVARRFLADGPTAFRDMAASLGGEDGPVEIEWRRIRLQDEFDAIQTQQDSLQAFDDRLFEADIEGEDIARDLDGWIVQRLQFTRRAETAMPNTIFRYQYHNSGNNRSTLVPVDTLLDRFHSVIDTDFSKYNSKAPCTFPLTFKRQVARRTQGIRLARLGDPFIDAMARYLRQDDRGVTFAMWRHRPRLVLEGRYQLAFRFDFIVEADTGPIMACLKDMEKTAPEALQRKADALLHPSLRTIWLDEQLQSLCDQAQLKRFCEPFVKDPRMDGGRDYNLNPLRWKIMEEFFDPLSWHSLCHAACEQSRKVLLNDPEFKEDLGLAKARAERISLVHIEQLRSRLLHQGTMDQIVAQGQIRHEESLARAMIQGIVTPTLRLDAVGAVFLSAEDPFVH